MHKRVTEPEGGATGKDVTAVVSMQNRPGWLQSLRLCRATEAQ